MNSSSKYEKEQKSLFCLKVPEKYMNTSSKYDISYNRNHVSNVNTIFF